MQSCNPAILLSFSLSPYDDALLSYPHMMILVEYMTTCIHSFQREFTAFSRCKQQILDSTFCFLLVEGPITLILRLIDI